ncbi:MAG TPA: hypothetical protein VHP36_10210 [Chitinispirillaceae bacterium]|nr:hypothetical protein [Chitinispirillaceae bacterium]
MYLPLTIHAQPTETTCGPTCLHAVYRYYEDSISLSQVISGVKALENGGTLAAHLACHALQRGYRATIFTYDLHLFDPVWFNTCSSFDMCEKMRMQAKYKTDPKFLVATNAYLEFIKLGGVIKLQDLSPSLISLYLEKKNPVIAGVNATYLYRSARETGETTCEFDDIRGSSSGHFIIFHGYDCADGMVGIADPIRSNPISVNRNYRIGFDRIVCATLLGVLTYDANLLIIEKTESDHAEFNSCQ